MIPKRSTLDLVEIRNHVVLKTSDAIDVFLVGAFSF